MYLALIIIIINYQDLFFFHIIIAIFKLQANLNIIGKYLIFKYHLKNIIKTIIFIFLKSVYFYIVLYHFYTIFIILFIKYIILLIIFYYYFFFN